MIQTRTWGMVVAACIALTGCEENGTAVTCGEGTQLDDTAVARKGCRTLN